MTTIYEISGLEVVPERRITSFPFVSIIVPVRNEAPLIADCLKSLLRQDYPQDRLEIIVVDNGSTDGSRRLIEQFPVRLLLEAKPGAGAARNRGAQAARGDYLAFTDADCMAPADWISCLVEVLEQEPEAAQVGGEVVAQAGSVLNEFLTHRGLGFDAKEHSADSGRTVLPWLLTGNVMVRRSMFQRVGGFEESFQPGEDIDLSWRMSLAGGYPRHLPDLQVVERRRYSLRHFYRKNFRTGIISDLLHRRFGSAGFQSGDAAPSLLSRLAWPVRRLRQHLGQLFKPGSGSVLSKKLSFLFFLCSGHLFFRLGKGIARIRYDFLKEPCPASPISRKGFTLHPVIQAGFLGAEDRLLYLSCSPKRNRMDRAAQIRHLSQIKDWGRLLEKSVQHRLQPRLYAFLKRQEASSFVPPQGWKELERAYHKAQAITLALEGELSELLPVLRKCQIKVLLLKGAALQQTVFREKPVRFFLDLDLMVREGDFPRVRSVLEERGYRFFPSPSPFPSRWHDQALGWEDRKVSFPFLRSERGLQVDIHLEPFEAGSPFRLKPGWLWEGAEQLQVGGEPADLPEPNRLFIHQLFHLAKHAADGEQVLGWYLDLDEMLRFYRERINEDFCWDVMKDHPHTAQLLGILDFLRTHFASPLPERFRRALQEETVEPVSLKSIFLKSGWVDRREQFFVNWSQVSGGRDKFLFVWKWIFPDARYFQTKYRFGSGAEKIVAYLRHGATVGAKAMSLSLHWIQTKTSKHRSGKLGV